MNTYWVRCAFPAADVTYRRHSVSAVQADSLVQAALKVQQSLENLRIEDHEIISIHSADDIENVVPKPFF
jgi:23S rRNA maturation-related 3'-5' exoribonuclease YhaM